MLLITLSLISVLNLFLGSLVLFRNRKNNSHITFFCVTLFGDGWLMSNYFADHASTVFQGILWTRVAMALGLFAVYSLFFFLSAFIKENRKINMVRSVLIAPLLITSALLLFTRGIVSSIEFEDNIANIVFGNFSVIYLLVFIIILFAALFTLVGKYRSTRGLEKKRLNFLFMGLAITFIIITIMDLVLPLVFNIYVLSPYGGEASIFLIGFTAYAIVKHRLMDIRLVIIRSISFSVLLLVLVSGFALPLYKLMVWAVENGVNLTSQIAIGAVAGIAIGFLMPYIRKGLTLATDAVFFKQEYDSEVFQKQINNILSSNIILSELLYKTLDYIIKEFRLESGMFVVAEEGQVYSVQAIGYKKTPEVEFKDVRYLSRFPIAVYDELEEGSRAKSTLRRYGAAVTVKLTEDRQFAGILFLGEKKSGDMLSTKDISTLEIIAPEIAMAMQRAKQYEEIQKFNITLKAEVLRKTRKLQEANEHLKELDQAKDEFISMASHQLRTPLTAIKGYLSMLLEGDAGDIKVGQYDFINEAFVGANKMVALINDLLNVSRMSTGKFFIDPKEIDMKALINEEIRELANTARQKGLYLKFEHPKAMPIVEADENKIRQVVMNYIDNAIYYTETGGITVKAMANKHDFVLEVHDTGIGVPKDMQAKLFTKFVRADNAKKLRPDGNGLGLYLAKRVVEDHGGEIIFRSTEGKGSVFGFRIPIKSKIKVDPNQKRLIAA